MVDAEVLHSAAPSSNVVMVKGMNHLFKYAPNTTSQAAFLKGYQDPSLPVDRRVVGAITAATRA